jgi:hypothetical protein
MRKLRQKHGIHHNFNRGLQANARQHQAARQMDLFFELSAEHKPPQFETVVQAGVARRQRTMC